jgi:pyroglutamyl-peptidase
MRILLTGFEPFGGSPINPSQEVVKALASCPPAGIVLHTVILPVTHRGGPEELLRALDRTQPEAVICLGEAGRRAGLSIERVAVNLVDDSIPDNAGERWVDQPVIAGGPAACFVTLPVKAMQQAMIDAGVPAELSLTAGTFLCNQVAYTLLHYFAARRQAEAVPAGFIHLPLLPEQAAARQIAHPETGIIPSMSLETQVRGLEAALKALI